MIAHQVISETLFGIAQSGIFGSKEELRNGFCAIQRQLRKRSVKMLFVAHWNGGLANLTDGKANCFTTISN